MPLITILLQHMFWLSLSNQHVFLYQISPAAGSPTTTLLRLDPSYRPQINKSEFFLNSYFLIFNLINSQRVTGGVYKTRVLVHRSMLIYDY